MEIIHRIKGTSKRSVCGWSIAEMDNNPNMAYTVVARDVTCKVCKDKS